MIYKLSIESICLLFSLKPENVLIGHDGYVQLTDFGLSETGVSADLPTYIFAGTPEYISPEQLRKKGAGPDADWWALGAIIYEMLVGKPPFYDKETSKLWDKILTGEVNYPREYLSKEAIDLISKLLNPDVTKRLGRQGAKEIKGHKFFKGINFRLLYEKRIKPPFLPRIKSMEDTKYVDDNFLNMNACDSFNPKDIIDVHEDPFMVGSLRMTYEEDNKFPSDKKFSLDSEAFMNTAVNTEEKDHNDKSSKKIDLKNIAIEIYDAEALDEKHLLMEYYGV